MLLTVTLNPCLDKSLFVERNAPEESLRARSVRNLAGGKGVNVSRALRGLGAEVQTLMPLGGFAGSHVAQLARAEGLAPLEVPIAGATRCAITILETPTGQTWHYLEPGPSVSEEEIERIRQCFRQAAASARLVIISGSVPCDALSPTVPWMVETARELGCDTIVDTHGAALPAALAARPWMVKPNLEELKPVIGFSLSAEESQWRALSALAEAGIQVAALSLGADGLRCLWGGRAFYVASPRVDAVNVLGCGDSLVAGVAFAHLHEDPPAECLRFGVACATANAMTWDPGGIDAGAVAAMLPRVEVRELERKSLPRA
jgi:1-phosphofructokinase family hexose kinase